MVSGLVDLLVIRCKLGGGEKITERLQFIGQYFSSGRCRIFAIAKSANDVARIFRREDNLIIVSQITGT